MQKNNTTSLCTLILVLGGILSGVSPIKADIGNHHSFTTQLIDSE